MSDPFAEPLGGQEEFFDLTPLIDTVFILLLFFLVATSLQVHEQQIPIRLPESSGGAPQERQEETLVLSVQADGTIYLGRDKVEMDALAQELRARKAKAVEIRGDTQTALGDAVKLIDVCTEAGVEKLQLGTAPEKRP